MLACFMACATEVFAATSASALLRDMDTFGPRTVLTRLWADQGQFDQICSEIASGDAQWLEVARRLKAVADSGASLALRYAVAQAIPIAPTRVLALIDHGFTIDEVCTSPFIEPGPGVAEEYRRRAVLALRSVSSVALQPVRNQCLAKVESPVGSTSH